MSNAGVSLEHWGQDPINTLGPIRVTEALLPSIERAERPLVVAIGPNIGSIAGPRDRAYRSGKTAAQATIHGLDRELPERRIGVLLLPPDRFRTRMGGEGAPCHRRRA